jgi:long-chain-fatty-acid---luciferin-component ligase
LDLIERISDPIQLHPTSILKIGGGWKAFGDVRLPRAELLERAERALGLRAGEALEGYGMSECNALCNRCQHDRFHIPPVLKPIIYDDALLPIEPPGRGRFGFSDPFASCYPGFVVSGDEVELTREPCACGRQGWSIVGEIRRAAGQEVKGCGGVMASVRM